MSSENTIETPSDVEEHNKCVLIMRQTDYDIETAKTKLKDFNGDIVAIIRDYIKNDDTEKQDAIKKPSETLNQKIYGEIRELLDDASDMYRKKKEAEEANKKRKEEIKKHIIKLKEQTSIKKLFNVNTTNPTYSIDVYVPPTKILEQKLINKIKEFENKQPLFLNISIHNSKFDQHIQFLKNIIKQTNITITIHIDLSGYTLEDFNNNILEISKLHIKNIVLSEGLKWTSSSLDIIEAIKYVKNTFTNDKAFTIGCKGYPEGHTNKIHIIKDRNLTNTEASRAGYDDNSNIQVCSDIEFNKEIDILKNAQKAGADYIVSQLFYDVGVFLQYCITLREAGINIPIIPSIMPIKSYDAFTRITSTCKTRIPNNIQKTVHQCKKNEKKCCFYGKKLALSTSKSLILRGIQHIHYQSNNEIEQCKDILEHLQVVFTRQ